MTRFDPEAWIALLDEYGVDYVLVGGYAAVLHGARRPTLDIDVVPRWERENLERLCDALRTVEAVSTTVPRVEGDAVTPDILIEREVMTWNTSLGRIDTMVGIPDSEGMPVDFDALGEHAGIYVVCGIQVAVASLDDVITSKEFARRPKDAKALPELRSLRARSMGASGESDTAPPRQPRREFDPGLGP